MRRRGLVAIGVVLGIASIAGGLFAHRRYVVGRAPAEVCAETQYGKMNVPNQGFAVLDTYGWGTETETVFELDGKVRKGAKSGRLPAGDVQRLEDALVATGIYDLGSGCFAGWTPAVPSDEGAVHIWLVRNGVGHEYAWLTGHRHPRALDDAALKLHMAGYRALGP